MPLNDKNYSEKVKILTAKPKELTDKEKTRLPKGQIPYGYKLSKKGLLIKDQQEQAVIKKIIKLSKSRQSLRQICYHLDSQRIKSKNGKTWHPNTIRKILQKI